MKKIKSNFKLKKLILRNNTYINLFSVNYNVYHFINSNKIFLYIPNYKYDINNLNQNSKFKIIRNYKIPNKYIPTILSVNNLPPCIINTCNKNNIKFVNSENDSTIIWKYYPQLIMERFINEICFNQHYNHFITTKELSNKESLYKHYFIYKLLFPEDYNFYSETYYYPEQLDKLLIKYKDKKNIKWILKPTNLSRGRGIKILSCIDKNLKLNNKYLISKYIDNPHLINNKKYDLRLYVLIFSFTPLKIYLYKESIVRFATEDYKNDNFDNMFMHLTNYSINIKNEKYNKNEDGLVFISNSQHLKLLSTKISKPYNSNSILFFIK